MTALLSSVIGKRLPKTAEAATNDDGSAAYADPSKLVLPSMLGSCELGDAPNMVREKVEFLEIRMSSIEDELGRMLGGSGDEHRGDTTH